MSKQSTVDLDSVGQLQIRLFHETASDAVRELARQYISPGGKEHGVKAFARRLFPLKSDEQAYTRFMNCTNPNTKDVFDEDEWREIFRIGHEQNKHFVLEFFCGPLYQLAPVDPNDVVKRAKRAKRMWHLEELKRLEADE